MSKLMVLIIIQMILLSFGASAQDSSNPFRRRVSHNDIARKIINFIDHSSVGLVQTIIGAGHVTYIAISEGRDSIETHSPEDFEIFQIQAENSGTPYSVGLFQIGDGSEDHEGGHAVASSVLGPLYLPTVLLSYLFQGGASSFMEEWADLEADHADDFYYSNQAEVGYGIIQNNGQTHDVLVIKISLDEHQTMEHDYMSSYKAYHWLQTRVAIPLSNYFASRSSSLPVYVEIDLLEKNLILNTRIFHRNDHDINFNVETQQHYGHIDNSALLQMLHIRAMDLKVNYGFSYSLRDALSISILAGFQGSMNTLRPYVFYDSANPYFLNRTSYAEAGFQAEFRMTLFEYLSLIAGLERTWTRNSLNFRRYYAQITNEFRAPNRQRAHPFIQAMELSIQASREEVNFNSPARRRAVNRGDVTFGIRF